MDEEPQTQGRRGRPLAVVAVLLIAGLAGAYFVVKSKKGPADQFASQVMPKAEKNLEQFFGGPVAIEWSKDPEAHEPQSENQGWEFVHNGRLKLENGMKFSVSVDAPYDKEGKCPSVRLLIAYPPDGEKAAPLPFTPPACLKAGLAPDLIKTFSSKGSLVASFYNKWKGMSVCLQPWSAGGLYVTADLPI